VATFQYSSNAPTSIDFYNILATVQYTDKPSYTLREQESMCEHFVDSKSSEITVAL